MIKAIFAVDHWGGMGNNGTLPWPHHSEDLQYFKEQTLNHIVVMGRRTWDDPKMPKPLPNRLCYVATNRSIDYNRTLKGDLKTEIKNLQTKFPKLNVWIIGGPDILLQTKSLIDELHITHFKAGYRTDVKLDLHKFLLGFRVMSSKPSTDRNCNWMVYKNIDVFR
jgi:dihydrofolate reductase